MVGGGSDDRGPGEGRGGKQGGPPRRAPGRGTPTDDREIDVVRRRDALEDVTNDLDLFASAVKLLRQREPAPRLVSERWLTTKAEQRERSLGELVV